MTAKYIYSLTLHSLSQQDQEDWTGSDEVWLRVFADGKETVSDKRKFVNKWWQIDRIIPTYAQSCQISIWELDWDWNDLLGSVDAAALAEGTKQSKVFKNKQNTAQYTLIYSLDALSVPVPEDKKDTPPLEIVEVQEAKKQHDFEEAQYVVRDMLPSPPDSPWTGIVGENSAHKVAKWKQFCGELKDILGWSYYSHFPYGAFRLNQRYLSICAPVLFLHLLACRNPLRLVYIMVDIWKDGRFWGREESIDCDTDVMAFAPKTAADYTKIEKTWTDTTDVGLVEWMFACTLLEDENWLVDWGKEANDAGDVTWSDIEDWVNEVLLGRKVEQVVFTGAAANVAPLFMLVAQSCANDGGIAILQINKRLITDPFDEEAKVEGTCLMDEWPGVPEGSQVGVQAHADTGDLEVLAEKQSKTELLTVQKGDVPWTAIESWNHAVALLPLTTKPDPRPLMGLHLSGKPEELSKPKLNEIKADKGNAKVFALFTSWGSLKFVCWTHEEMVNHIGSLTTAE